MVQVIVLEAKHRRTEYYRLYLEVSGLSRRSPSDVLEFLTAWAESLGFDYIVRSDELHDWGYFIAELSRGKIPLGVIPANTRHFTVGEPVDCSKERCLHLFVDVGSPVRHFYAVYCEERSNRETSCLVHGVGILIDERFRVDVDIVENFVEEPGIRTIIYPRADPATKRIFKRIIELSATHKQNEPMSRKPKQTTRG
ncbi:MAG: hypothetical protein QW196_03615 [Sulfolobales archaeon]